MKDLIARLRVGTGGGKHWMDLHEEAADEIERLTAERWLAIQIAADLAIERDALRSAIDYIGTSASGGELFFVGPTDIEYSADGNTVARYVGPWHFLDGKGDTFLEAVQNQMAKEARQT